MFLKCVGLPAGHRWWAGSRRSPLRTGTGTLWTETNFHGIRCLGHRGTPGAFPRRERESTWHPQWPVGTRRHLRRQVAARTRSLLRERYCGENGWSYRLRCAAPAAVTATVDDNRGGMTEGRARVEEAAPTGKHAGTIPTTGKQTPRIHAEWSELTDADRFRITDWSAPGFFPKKLHEEA